jgi:hypothetical protein
MEDLMLKNISKTHQKSQEAGGSNAFKITGQLNN